AVVGAKPPGWDLDERAVREAGGQVDATLAFMLNHPGLPAEAAGEGPLLPRPAARRTQIADRQAQPDGRARCPIGGGERPGTVEAVERRSVAARAEERFSREATLDGVLGK